MIVKYHAAAGKTRLCDAEWLNRVRCTRPGARTRWWERSKPAAKNNTGGAQAIICWSALAVQTLARPAATHAWPMISTII